MSCLRSIRPRHWSGGWGIVCGFQALGKSIGVKASCSARRSSTLAERVVAAVGETPAGCNPVSFSINPDHVDVLSHPSEFYETLIQRVQSATRRISLAALYLGTGRQELRFVRLLDQQLRHHADLALTTVFDASRGTRLVDGSSTLSLLARTATDRQGRVKLAFFVVPQLLGSVYARAPTRYREGIGVMHMKAFVFDDTVILSGANLSSDYFTNRQDRYFVIRDEPHVAQYFHDLIDGVADCSLVLQPGSQSDSLDWQQQLYPGRVLHGCGAPTVFGLEHGTAPIQHHLAAFAGRPQRKDNSSCQVPATGTSITPLLQCHPLRIRCEEYVTQAVLSALSQSDQLDLACGYFNLPEALVQPLLKPEGVGIARLLTAAPEANGFFDSQGISSALPTAYSLNALDFVKQAKSAGRSESISVFEYGRSGWTFHAKGLWVRERGAPPCVTMVGSPNFGRRSLERDLECQVMILTDDAELQRQLANEVSRQFEQPFVAQADEATLTGQDRKLHGMSWSHGHWIRLGRQIVRPLM